MVHCRVWLPEAFNGSWISEVWMQLLNQGFGWAVLYWGDGAPWANEITRFEVPAVQRPKKDHLQLYWYPSSNSIGIYYSGVEMRGHCTSNHERSAGKEQIQNRKRWSEKHSKLAWKMHHHDKCTINTKCFPYETGDATLACGLSPLTLVRNSWAGCPNFCSVSFPSNGWLLVWIDVRKLCG